jgi:hypothetical protein
LRDFFFIGYSVRSVLSFKDAGYSGSYNCGICNNRDGVIVRCFTLRCVLNGVSYQNNTSGVDVTGPVCNRCMEELKTDIAVQDKLTPDMMRSIVREELAKFFDDLRVSGNLTIKGGKK